MFWVIVIVGVILSILMDPKGIRKRDDYNDDINSRAFGGSLCGCDDDFSNP